MSSISGTRVATWALRGAVVTLCLFSGTAAADTWFTWTGAYSPDPTNFHRLQNWTPEGGPPNDNTDKVLFTPSPSSSYTVTWDTAVTTQMLEVDPGADVMLICDNDFTSQVYTLDSVFGSAFIGLTAGPTAQLTLLSNSYTTHAIEADSFLSIGNNAGSHGKLVVDRFRWTGPTTLVGVGGIGELELKWGGAMENVNGSLGLDPGSTGSAVFDGGGWWGCSNTLTVGNQGSGTIDMISDGWVDVGGDAYLAKSPGSTANVTIFGTDVTWDSTGSLYVGGNDTSAGGAATLSVEHDATLTVGNDLMLYGGNSVTLDGATINAGSISGGVGVLNWSSGTLHITGQRLLLDVGEPLGVNPEIGTGMTLAVDNVLDVGVDIGADFIVVDGGTVTSGSGRIGSVEPGAVASSVLVATPGSSWAITGDFGMGGTQAANLTVEQGASLSTGTAMIASLPAATAYVNLRDPSAQWNATGAVYLGGDSGFPGGTATMWISGGAEVHVGGLLRVWEGSSIELGGGGVLTASALDLHGGATNDAGFIEVVDGSVSIAGGDATLEGAIDIQGSTMTVSGGGQFYGTTLGDATTHMGLTGADTYWGTEAPLFVGSATAGANRMGSLTVGTGAFVIVEGTVSVLEPGALSLTGGYILAGDFDLGGADFQGYGGLTGRVRGTGGVITATGDLHMGSSASPLGFSHGGELRVGSHRVTLQSGGFARAGALTTIQTGGELSAPNGLLLDGGDALIGRGTVSAPVAAGFGSTIALGEGEGGLSLGDSDAPDGFFSDGILDVGTSTVTLRDANVAVLGSLTTIGAGESWGMLVADNGALVDFGKNVVGCGFLDTPDDPATPLINNGAIEGLAYALPIQLSGYVKGVGTMDNVLITGTDAPGFSTARVYRGSMTYGGTLEIEIGGTEPGSGHDQINHTGTAGLGGELRIEVVDGFEPQVGQTFTIMTYAARVGQFATVTGTGVCGEPVFAVEYGDTALTLTVVEALPGDVNVDGDVDLADFAGFPACESGPGGMIPEPCRCFDVDSSSTVDLQDYALLQRAFTGG